MRLREIDRERRDKRKGGASLVVQWPKLWDPDAGWGDRVGSLVRELDPTRQLRKKKEEEEREKQESWEDRDKKRGRWGVRETQVPPPGPLGGTNLPALEQTMLSY